MALSASSNSPGLPCHLVFPHPPLAKDLIGSICTRTWNGQKKLVKKYTAKRIQSPTANASEICSGSLGRLSSLTGRDLVPCRDTWMWSSVSIMFGKLKQSFGQCVMSLFGDGFGSKCTYTSRRRSLRECDCPSSGKYKAYPIRSTPESPWGNVCTLGPASI